MKEKQEFNWEQLLALIEKQKVIPVVGRDLLTMETTEGRLHYHRLLAQKLADDLDVPESALLPDFHLNEAAVAFIKSKGRQRIYSCLKKKLDDTPVQIPSSLLKLAQISHFKLFINTSFDMLLTQALNQVRYDGEERTQTLSYSLHDRSEDLPDNFAKDNASFVFQVFGTANYVTDYAVTDEDYDTPQFSDHPIR